MRIYQFKGDNLVSYSTEDFQIILIEGENGTVLSDNNDDINGRIYAPPSTSYKVKIVAEDSESESMSLEVYSELVTIDGSLSFSTYDSTHEERVLKVGLLVLTNLEQRVADRPFPVVVRATYERPEGRLQSDAGYLFYFKDTELEDRALPNPQVIVLGAEEEKRIARYHPNPVKDFLFLENKGEKSVTLYNNDGKVEFKSSTYTEPYLDLRQLEQGTYLLLVNQNNKRSVMRVVKE